MKVHAPDVVAIVGDFLDNSLTTEGQLFVGRAAEVLSHLDCANVVFIRGNHEDEALWEFHASYCREGREFRLIDGQAIEIGPLVIIGFPCLIGGAEGFLTDVPADLDRWLPQLMRRYGPAARTLWLMVCG